MNEAFENAFYQLDRDRDGVIMLRDLERYVREHNLKDKFIQKWLTLFADDKNVIYYDKFCETMGIVPAPEKFDQKTYRMDMTEETRAVVLNVVNEFADMDSELSIDTLASVIRRLSELLGDNWKIKLDPTKLEVDVQYAPDGLVYFSQRDSDKPRILVYREELESVNGYLGLTYEKDMSSETEKSVKNIISLHRFKDNYLNYKNVEEIINDIECAHGDKWSLVLSPKIEDLNVSYKEDGMLYYSLDETEDPKILVWRMPLIIEDEGKEIIYESIMSDSVKEGVLETVRHNYTPNCDMSSKTEIILKELDKKFGITWHMLINPSEQQLEVDYDFEGKIYFTPNSNENLRILIWRKDKEKIRGKMCFCCF